VVSVEISFNLLTNENSERSIIDKGVSRERI
jgi:hypothetical protein